MKVRKKIDENDNMRDKSNNRNNKEKRAESMDKTGEEKPIGRKKQKVIHKCQWEL